MQKTIDRNPGAWLLFVGLVLVSLGLVSESRQTDPPEPLRTYPSYATATANARRIAATGIDVTGSSILYLVDTEARQLAVYQAQGGTRSTMSLKFVGARNIDLDLQVNGYNDKSEYTYSQLAEEFAKGSNVGSDE